MNLDHLKDDIESITKQLSTLFQQDKMKSLLDNRILFDYYGMPLKMVFDDVSLFVYNKECDTPTFSEQSDNYFKQYYLNIINNPNSQTGYEDFISFEHIQSIETVTEYLFNHMLENTQICEVLYYSLIYKHVYNTIIKPSIKEHDFIFIIKIH